MKRVLLVDDNPANLHLVRFILKKNGYDVIEAENGLDGVRVAIEEHPDLVLMDIQLPDIHGLEATRRIRESKTACKIPIVAVTSYAMTGDKEKALEAGCDGYISKPINVDTFIEDIQRFIAVPSGAAAGQS
jgi:two-component system cell cycle response regulator DivK